MGDAEREQRQVAAQRNPLEGAASAVEALPEDVKAQAERSENSEMNFAWAKRLMNALAARSSSETGTLSSSAASSGYAM